MRRLLLLSTIAAMMVAMLVASAMPAFAAFNAKTTQTTGANGSSTTPNCIGAGQSQAVSGTSLNPGSAAHLDTNFTLPGTNNFTFNGPFTSTVAKNPALLNGTGHGVGQFVPSTGNLTCPMHGKSGS